MKMPLTELLGAVLQQTGAAGGRRAYESLAAALIPPVVAAARGAGWSRDEVLKRIGTAWEQEGSKD